MSAPVGDYHRARVRRRMRDPRYLFWHCWFRAKRLVGRL